jgi:hypothetical protein
MGDLPEPFGVNIAVGPEYDMSDVRERRPGFLHLIGHFAEDTKIAQNDF